MRDDHPIFPDAHAAHGGRADFARNFGDGPERRLVGAIVLGDVERMFFHEVKTLAQLEGGADGLAVVFGHTEKTIDAIVAFRVLDAAGADQRGVYRLRGGENFDGVDVKLAVLIRCAIGVDAQKQVARNRREWRGQLRGVFDIARRELCGGELQSSGIDSAAGAEEVNVQRAL